MRIVLQLCSVFILSLFALLVFFISASDSTCSHSLSYIMMLEVRLFMNAYTSVVDKLNHAYPLINQSNWFALWWSNDP